MVNITLKSSQMVQPAAPTPQRDLWISNVDLVAVTRHATTVYFYRPSGSDSSAFFSMDVLKDALNKVLVPFYPIAGTLKKDTHEHGRIQINCNAEEALLVDAVTDSVINDFGDFAPSQELTQLVPQVDSSSEDVTFFKCGGVSLGTRMHHTVVDGYSGIHFINSWCEVARGINITQVPYIDRTILQVKNTPTPKFPHIEYQPPPPLKEKSGIIINARNDSSVRIFKISKGELDSLKAKAAHNGNKVKYSTYEVLSGHIWRCACKARNLNEDQQSKMRVAVDSRTRLRPPLPLGYFGNVIFVVTPMALAGNLTSKSIDYAASIIHEVLAQIDDEYSRSALDYLELQGDLTALVRESHTFRNPNIGITSWCGLPIYDADFGWGRPIFMGPANIYYESHSYILPSPINDGSLLVAIRLGQII